MRKASSLTQAWKHGCSMAQSEAVTKNIPSRSVPACFLRQLTRLQLDRSFGVGFSRGNAENRHSAGPAPHALIVK